MNVNKAIVCGRVTRDPEVRTTPSGATVVKFSMATNSHYTDKAGTKQEETQFHNITLWNKVAEIAAQYLVKGQECYIEGKMKSTNYTDKQGIERRSFDIIGDTLQLGARPKGMEYPGANQYDKGPAKDATVQQAPAEEIPSINLDEEEDAAPAPKQAKLVEDEVKLEDVPF